MHIAKGLFTLDGSQVAPGTVSRLWLQHGLAGESAAAAEQHRGALPADQLAARLSVAVSLWLLFSEARRG